MHTSKRGYSSGQSGGDLVPCVRGLSEKIPFGVLQRIRLASLLQATVLPTRST